jgi:hypothetical protein
MKRVPTPSFSSLDPASRTAAIAAYSARDGAGFALAGRSGPGMLRFIMDNWKPLQARGMCESALTHAILACPLNNCHWGMGMLECLFASLDREKLLALGDPLPEQEVHVLYRGVSGRGQRRQIRGLSWTSAFDVACWFADRSREFGNPAVYAATTVTSQIYLYSNKRGRHEFIVRPGTVRPLNLMPEDLRERHGRIQDRLAVGGVRTKRTSNLAPLQ